MSDQLDTIATIATAYAVSEADLRHLVDLYIKHGIRPMHHGFFEVDEQQVVVAACPLTMQLIDAGADPRRADPQDFYLTLCLVKEVLGFSNSSARLFIAGYDDAEKRRIAPAPVDEAPYRLGAAIRFAHDRGVVV